MRELECGIRDLVDNWPDQLLALLAQARALTGSEDDLPSLEEMSGAWSRERDAIYEAISEPDVDAAASAEGREG